MHLPPGLPYTTFHIEYNTLVLKYKYFLYLASDRISLDFYRTLLSIIVLPIYTY